MPPVHAGMVLSALPMRSAPTGVRSVSKRKALSLVTLAKTVPLPNSNKMRAEDEKKLNLEWECMLVKPHI